MSDIFPRLQREAQSIDEGQEQHAFTLPFESIPEYTRQKSPVLKAQDEISGDEKEYQFVHSPVCRDAAVQIFGFLKKLSEAKPVKDKSEKQEQSASDELELSQAEVAVINEHVDSIFLILEFSNYLGLEEVISSIGTFLATENLLEKREGFLKKLRLDNLKYDISRKLLMQLPKEKDNMVLSRSNCLRLGDNSLTPYLSFSNSCQYALGGFGNGVRIYRVNTSDCKTMVMNCGVTRTKYNEDGEYRITAISNDGKCILSAKERNKSTLQVLVDTDSRSGYCINLPCECTYKCLEAIEPEQRVVDLRFIDDTSKFIIIVRMDKCCKKLSFYIGDITSNSYIILKPDSVDTERKLSFLVANRHPEISNQLAVKMINNNEFIMVDYSTRQVAHVKYNLDTFEIVGIGNIFQNSKLKPFLAINTPSTSSIMTLLQNPENWKLYLCVNEIDTMREFLIECDCKKINKIIYSPACFFYQEGSLIMCLCKSSYYCEGYDCPPVWSSSINFNHIILNPRPFLICNQDCLTYQDELILHKLITKQSKFVDISNRTYYSLFSILPQSIQKRLVEYLAFIPPAIDHDNTSIQYSRIKKDIADQFKDMRQKKSVSALTANLLLKKIVKKARLRKQYVPFCKSDFNSEKEYLWPNANLSNRNIKANLINNRITL